MVININKNYEVINDYIEDKEVYSKKVVDNIPNDLNKAIYKYHNGELVKIRDINFDDIKMLKLEELEKFYINLMEQGLNYNGYVYDISQEAQEDRRDIADTINESLDLYGEDSEQMQYVLSQIYFMPKVALPNNEGILGFKSIDEWKAFSLAFMTQVVTNSNIYYTLKQKIELATTQEELDNIKF